jgi:hypothetical protein
VCCPLHVGLQEPGGTVVCRRATPSRRWGVMKNTDSPLSQPNTPCGCAGALGLRVDNSVAAGRALPGRARGVLGDRATGHPSLLTRKRMRERLMISVSFDPALGYVATGGELPVLAALSLSGLWRQLEDAHRGEDVEIKLVLDRAARIERDQRRRGGAARIGDAWPK